MHHVRGNHDAMTDPTIAIEGAPFAVELAGVILAVLDTVVPGTDGGQLAADQLAMARRPRRRIVGPVLVFGHHHLWNLDAHERSATYFGINPDDSEALVAVFARRDAIAGYFAGHTHRNRVRRFDGGPAGPDRRGRVREGLSGRVGRVPRLRGRVHADRAPVRAPAAIAWTERTRAMFAGLLPRLRPRPDRVALLHPDVLIRRDREQLARVEVRDGVRVGREEGVGAHEPVPVCAICAYAIDCGTRIAAPVSPATRSPGRSARR